MSLLAARHASTASRTCLHGSVSRCKTVLCWGCSLRGLQLAAETKSKSAKLDNRIFSRPRFHCRSRFRCWLVVTRNIKSKFPSSRPSKLTGLYPIKKRTRTNPTRWPKSETSEVGARFVMMQHCATLILLSFLEVGLTLQTHQFNPVSLNEHIEWYRRRGISPNDILSRCGKCHGQSKRSQRIYHANSTRILNQLCTYQGIFLFQPSQNKHLRDAMIRQSFAPHQPRPCMQHDPEVGHEVAQIFLGCRSLAWSLYSWFPLSVNHRPGTTPRLSPARRASTPDSPESPSFTSTPTHSRATVTDLRRSNVGPANDKDSATVHPEGEVA